MSNIKIRVVIKRVGEPAIVEEIENNLNALREIVDGYIEMPFNHDFPKGVSIVCNEEGKLKGLQPNIHWGDSDVICGNFLITSHNRSGIAISLTDEQVEFAQKFIAENDVSDYAKQAARHTASYNKFQNFLQEIVGIEPDELAEFDCQNNKGNIEM